MHAPTFILSSTGCGFRVSGRVQTTVFLCRQRGIWEFVGQIPQAHARINFPFTVRRYTFYARKRTFSERLVFQKVPKKYARRYHFSDAFSAEFECSYRVETWTNEHSSGQAENSLTDISGIWPYSDSPTLFYWTFGTVDL